MNASPVASPVQNQPVQKAIVATIQSSDPIAVTWLGDTPNRAASRVKWNAQVGHRYLVSRSVTPLYAPAWLARSITGTFSGTSRSAKGRSRLRSASLKMPASASAGRSEEHTSELQSLMRISYAVFCLKKKKYNKQLR